MKGDGKPIGWAVEARGPAAIQLCLIVECMLVEIQAEAATARGTMNKRQNLQSGKDMKSNAQAAAGLYVPEVANFKSSRMNTLQKISSVIALQKQIDINK